MCMYVCACGEVTWRLDEVDVGGAMELRLGMAGWCYDVTIGGASAISEVLIRMGAMGPLDGDRLSCLVLNVTWTWACTRSNRDWMLEVKVC